MSRHADQKIREIQNILLQGEQLLARQHPLTGTPFKKMLLDSVPGMDEALSELAIRASNLTKKYNHEQVCLASLDPKTLYKAVLHAVFNLKYDEAKGWEIKRNTMFKEIGFVVLDTYVASLDNPQALYDNLENHCIAKGYDKRKAKSVLKKIDTLLNLKALRIGGLVHKVLEDFLLKLFDCDRGEMSAYTYRLKGHIAEQLGPLIESHIRTSKSLGFTLVPPKELTPDSLYRTQRYLLDRREPQQRYGRIISKPSEAALRAANKLQATPFSVDTRVLEVLVQLSDEEKAEIACKGKDVTDEQRARKLQEFKSVIESAQQIAEIGPVYFPVFFDFRGRLFYEADTTSVLSPQSAKWARSLLTFHEGAPLGTMGWGSLINEYANAVGHDKVALSERHGLGLKDVIANAGLLNDPLSEDAKQIWMDAEEPVKALGLLFEITAIAEKGVDRNGLSDCVSRSIIHFDGTCNGIQHIACLSKSVEMARAVNIIGDITTRRDIYQQVADAAKEMTTDPLVHQLLEKHGRKLCKQPTMTVPYGAQDVYRQVRSTLRELGVADADTLTSSVTKAIKEATSKVLVGLDDLDDALKGFADDRVAEDSDPSWTTPAGFVVTQQYREKEYKEEKVFGTFKVKMPAQDRSGPIIPNKNRSSIRANVIHSLDACHLQMTVDSADFSLVTIHDSFGVHAGNAMQLQRLLAEALQQMYEHDVLALITNFPAQGDLDLAEHHISPHAFS